MITMEPQRWEYNAVHTTLNYNWNTSIITMKLQLWKYNVVCIMYKIQLEYIDDYYETATLEI